MQSLGPIFRFLLVLNFFGVISAAAPNIFRQGQRYPDKAEVSTCGNIRDVIRRNSARFRKILVRNTNSEIEFRNDDSRRMTARAKSKLDVLASRVRTQWSGSKLRVLKAWTDQISAQQSVSLHYEGRALQLQVNDNDRWKLGKLAGLAAESGFDWVHFVDTNYIHASVIRDVCQTSVDLAFILDTSGSVGSYNFEKMKTFVKNIVDFFNIGSNGTHVGVVTYSSWSRVEFNFKVHNSKSTLKSAVNRIYYRSGWTYTADALDLVRRNIFQVSNGMRPDKGIPKVVVLLTDGYSNGRNPAGAAQTLRDSGVNVFCIGIGRYNPTELNDIATDPDSDHVYKLESFNDLSGWVDTLSAVSCDEGAAVSSCDDTESGVEGGSFLYFRTQFSSATGGISVEVKDFKGVSHLYVSLTNKNPGPLDDSSYKNESSISPRSLRITFTSRASTLIYVAVQGQYNTNRFKLSMWDTLFSSDSYSAKVKEEQSPPQNVITVSSSVSGYRLEYSIVDGNSQGLFKIDSSSGQIRTRGQLDRERESRYRLTVLAQDLTNACHKGRTVVILNVEDINDNPPRFAKNQYQYKIREKQRAGTLVAIVTATDADAGTNAQLTYGLRNNENKFTINNRGEVRTTAPLNFEQNSSYDMRVTATDGQTTATAQLTVTVVDVNERPSFPAGCGVGNCQLNVSEAEKLGTNILTLTATDPDNDPLSYSLRIQDSQDKVFTINAGRITLLKRLDRETKALYNLIVTANDGRTPPLAAEIRLKVIVTDMNDNAPVFPLNTYQASVYEDVAIGSIVKQVTASDADIGSNARVTYSLVSGDTSYFIIDQQGTITSTKKFDRETRASYQLGIRATDGGSPSKHSQTTVNIRILDVNDERPSFTKNQYTAYVDENASVGHSVVTVSASDRDTGINADLRFSILSGNEEHSFILNAKTGVITVAMRLDYERMRSYNLGISVSDRGSPPLSSASRLVINVNDINDNFPVFNPSVYRAAVRENSAKGTSVLKVFSTDRDSGTNGAIRYSIESGNDGSTFNIDASTGVISVNQSPDFETKPLYDLTVQASDQGSQSKTATTKVKVTIEDVNDHSPVFNPTSYSKQIPENVAIATVITTVTATDRDSGPRGRVVYRITSGNDGNKFTIDGNSGHIQVSSPLDRETKASYSLRIEARDGANKYRSSSAQVSITITDINDNSPLFGGSYVFRVSESVAVGHRVGQVVATDSDAGQNGDVTYSLNDNTDVFQVNPTSGDIILIKRVDHERKATYLLSMTARDNGTLPRATRTVVNVIVDDVNDNPPRFAKDSYNCSVAENLASGVAVCYVTATDADSGDNGRLAYSISGGNTRNSFRINRASGEITTSSPLDRENIASYRLTITAEDGQTARSAGSTSAATTVNIVIQDENDNQPSFTQLSYTYRVREDASIGYEIGQVTALDRDDGSNGRVTYSILSGNIGDSFKINPQSGAITIKSSLNREQIVKYTLTVKAMDSGTPSQSDKAVVTVALDDVNDNAPQFTQQVFYGKIREDASVASTVLQVIAQDRDAGTNGQLSFTLSGKGSANFTIDSTGFVLTKTPLDFEKTSSYFLIVTARDGGTPPQSASAHVNISIINVNDNVPTFVSPAQVTLIPEDIAVDTRVVKLNATDSDGSALTFDITEGNAGSSFKISRLTGLISVAKKLDRETTANYTLVVKATEIGSGGKSVFNNATIRVLDVNDNAPVFHPSSLAESLSENLPKGQSIATVKATDLDEGNNARINYELTTGDKTKFQVNPTTGVVVTKVELDRERQSVYTLRVTARDHGTPSQSSVATVTVTVNDVNDNSPQFSENSYTVTVMENTAVGSTILRVQAADPDAGVNGRVQYSIIYGNFDSGFRIDVNSSAVMVNKVIDRELKNSYSLTIRAQDSASISPRHTDVSVYVTVADENDNAPNFTSQANVFNIDENRARGVLVGVVTATDKDIGNNAKVAYSILNRDGSVFAIDGVSGRITVKGNIDRETVARYTLTIRASDRGSPVMFSDKQFVVVVNDVNDNPPVFDSSFFTGFIPENSPKMTSVLTVTAHDADTGPNAVLQYQIVSGNAQGRFIIDAVTGQINATMGLDYEEKSKYVLQVSASDTKYTVQTTVTINVININDITPTFSKHSYTALVQENTAVLTLVTKVSASDGDPFGSLVYSIKPGNHSSKFSIDLKNGVISTAEVLDREVSDRYTIEVQVTDNGDPSLSDVATVTIDVTDVNDNIPLFNTASFSVSINENIAIGSSILKLQATDMDLGTNANVFYNLTSSSAFAIDPVSGVIRNLIKPDREKVSSYVLYCQAADHGSPQLLSDLVPVHITVQDLNDNSPRFTENNYYANVSENAAVGTIVSEIQALDLDLGTGGLVAYGISTKQAMFVVANTTGVITLAGSLDREVRDSYILSVQARDHGRPSLESSATLYVNIIDINDNPPQFNSSSLRGGVQENKPKGTHVMRVLASDADTGSNAQLLFSLLTDEYKDVFLLDNSTGDIYTKKSLDREMQAIYTLRVSVSDKGTPSLSSSTTVTIDIIDVDDNCPRFQPSEYNATIFENLPRGTSIVTVIASDVDVIANKKIQFAIRSGSPGGEFTIDPEKGILKVGNGVDRESSGTFEVVVRAGSEDCGVNDTDGGNTAEGGTDVLSSAVAIINIWVKDLNDNAPSFQRSSYEYDFNDVNKVNLFTVIATDDDLGPGGVVKYRLAGQTEVGGNRVITVSAYDQGSPSLVNNVTVTIRTSISCEAMVFAITEDGAISTKTLCNFVITPRYHKVTTGNSHTFKCSAKGNTNPMYRWMMNGRFLSSWSLDGNYVISKLTNDDEGAYSCLASSDAGVIQSTAARLEVDERPEIIFHPENTSVGVGGTAKLECRAKGDPEPTYKWFKNGDVIPSINGIDSTKPVLILRDAILQDEGLYFCTVFNRAGDVSSNVASLKIYENRALISMEISVSNPDLAKRCHMFDVEAFKAELNKIVEVKVVIANYSAEGICEANPCNARPCRNGGECQVMITRDYTCTCPPGWYGKNCELDFNECQGDPCFKGGTCLNKNGTYECACQTNSTGKKCELTEGACAMNNCKPNEVCVLSESSNNGGFECKDKVNILQMTHAKEIQGNQKIFRLEKEIEGIIQSAPDSNSVSVISRRIARSSRTQSGTIDYGACVVRITSVKGRVVSFILLCPKDVDLHTTKTYVCGLIFKAGKAESCGASSGMMTPVPPTTYAPIEPMRVRIEMFARDRSGKNIAAEEFIGLINSDDFNRVMEKQGIKFVTAKQAKPKPYKESPPSNTGLIVGLVILAVLVVAAVNVAVYWYYKKHKKGDGHMALSNRAQMNRYDSRENIIGRNVSVRDIARAEKKFVNQAYNDSYDDDDEMEFMVEVNLGKPNKSSTALTKLYEAPWYYDKITPVEAEELLGDQVQPGTFVGHRGKGSDEYILTIKTPEGGPIYRHLLMKHTGKDKFMVQFGTMPAPKEFDTVSDVIDYFQVTPIEFEENSPDVILTHGWSKTPV